MSDGTPEQITAFIERWEHSGAAERANYASPFAPPTPCPRTPTTSPFLLLLNQTCAAKETAGQPTTPPGLPLPVEEHGGFFTGDCIQARPLNL